MAWIPIAAWIAAGVLALVVFGFCAYEIVWKTKRLKADLAELLVLREQLDRLRGEIASTQERLVATGLR